VPNGFSVYARILRLSLGRASAAESIRSAWREEFSSRCLAPGCEQESNSLPCGFCKPFYSKYLRAIPVSVPVDKPALQSPYY
jgi:hypothetical protein